MDEEKNTYLQYFSFKKGYINVLNLNSQIQTLMESKGGMQRLFNSQ